MLHAIQHKMIIMQGFIQALLLTSVFPEGLSLMAVGYNPTCVSTLALAAEGSKPLKALAISVIPGFQIAFPCITQ